MSKLIQSYNDIDWLKPITLSDDVVQALKETLCPGLIANLLIGMNSTLRMKQDGLDKLKELGGLPQDFPDVLDNPAAFNMFNKQFGVIFMIFRDAVEQARIEEEKVA